MSDMVSAIHSAADAIGCEAIATLLSLRPVARSNPDRARCFCPSHDDRKPSLDIARRNGRVLFICRACGEHGDILSLIAATEHTIDFPATLERAASLLGVPTTNEAPHKRVARDPVVALAQRIDTAADAWLAGRSWPTMPSATVPEIAEALELLLELDSVRAARTANCDARLDAEADRILAGIVEREGLWIQ